MDNPTPIPLPNGMVEIVESDKLIKIKYVQVCISEVILNYGARCYVVLLDAGRQAIDRINLELTGADYDRWIADDDIIDVILEKLGYSRAQVQIV